MRRADLRFYAELNDLVAPAKRFHTIEKDLGPRVTVKDLIESEGVPHTEVDLVVVNGEPVGFDYRVQDRDRISVFPVFESLDISGDATAGRAPLRRTRFVVDANLGKLARLLRLMGFDAAYRADIDDEEVVSISLRDRRVILTRDVGILKRSVVTHGYFVRAEEPYEQLREVGDRFDLVSSMRPFSRCSACNGSLRAATAEDVGDRVPPRVRRHFDRFQACEGCGRVYWQGSHHARLQRVARDLAADDRREDPDGGRGDESSSG